nr:FecR family protein [Pedobacter sp. ASV19]
MLETQAELLLSKYKQGTCTAEELALLETWYQSSTFTQPEFAAGEISEAKISVWNNLPINIVSNKWKLWPRLSIAASLLIGLCLGTYYFTTSKNQVNKISSLEQIAAGGTKATLILANGKRISLTSIPTGKVASLPGVTITKTNEGQLVYQVDGQQPGKQAEYNTIETPVGGTYQVNLPDGTKIWLNAGSSLKYPTVFAANERRVELLGEGYFEVTHNPEKPFIVKTARHQEVKVFGTHFNLSAYANDQIFTTTLYEGKVMVSNGQNEVVLKPFQQASLQNGSLRIAEVSDADGMSWKNDQFAFQNQALENILKTFERWYDVEFICPQELRTITFSGKISRQKTLKQALNIIDKEGTIHFKHEGRRIWVTK